MSKKEKLEGEGRMVSCVVKNELVKDLRMN